MVAFGVSPNMQIIDLKTGRLTREGFQLLQGINQALLGANSDVVQTDTTQTLTGKTIDGDANTLQDIATSSLKFRTGEDTRVVTGTAGTAGNFGSWNTDGDLIDSGVDQTDFQPADAELDVWATKTAPSGVVIGDTDSQTLSGKVITLMSHVVASLPAQTAGRIIYVSNETGGATVAFSDGTNWRRVQDRAIVS